MAQKKGSSRKSSTDFPVADAVRRGVARADDALRTRRQAIKQRSAAVARALRSRRQLAAVPKLTPHLRRAAGPVGSAGTLVAEGDSWFDYPLWDVLKMLEDEYGFEVESVAHRGDRVEDMAYGPGQLDAFCRRLEKLIRNNDPPRAILLSGGGNDIAGDEFRVLLNHAHSPIAGLNADVVHGIVDQRIRYSYITIIAQITRISETMLGRRIPIVTHGYDYAVPDGRGFLGGWGPLPGPWLEPGFCDKGFGDLQANKITIQKLIDRFNDMLSGLVRLDGFEHVKWVDLRNTLSSGAKYKDDWGNELHPTKSGFRRVAAKIAEVL
jgi:lysophospholipase L1-like esterase